MYSAIAEDHFHNARRVGPLEAESVTAPEHVICKGVAGAPGEGPYVVLWLEVAPDEQRIVRAAYRTFGCPAAIASASVLAELAEGTSVESAVALTEEDIVEALEGLPEGKGHCPPLAIGALRDALRTMPSQVDEAR